MEYLFAISEQLSAVPWMILLVHACWDHLRWSRTAAVAFCVGFTGWLVLAGVLCQNFHWLTDSLLVPSFLVACALLVHACRFWRLKTLWLVCTAVYLAGFVAYAALDIDVQVVGDTISATHLAWPGMAVQWGLSALFMALLWRPLEREVPDFLAQETYQDFWRYAWMLPAFSSLVLVVSLPEDSATLLVRRVGAVAFLFIVTQLVLMVLTYSFVVRLIRQSARMMRGMEENRQLQVALQEAHHQKDKVDAARRARHDLRHHVRAVLSLLREGDQDRAVTYLERVECEERSLGAMTYCENHIVDAIASYYLGRAGAAGARIGASLDVPDPVGIPDADLAVVVGNVLENALQAIERDAQVAHAGEAEPFVEVHARLVNGAALVFTCDNSCLVAPMENGQGGYVSTTLGGSGLGLSSVRRVAEDSGGTAQFSYAEGVFSSSVIVQLGQGAQL